MTSGASNQAYFVVSGKNNMALDELEWNRFNEFKIKLRNPPQQAAFNETAAFFNQRQTPNRSLIIPDRWLNQFDQAGSKAHLCAISSIQFNQNT